VSAPSTTRALIGLCRRDLLLAVRRRGEAVQPLAFFVLVSTLVPLGVGARPALLASVAPGVIWLAALLSTLLSLEALFRSDFDDGTLEQLLLSPHPLSLLVLGKIAVHWLMTGFPLLIASPLLAVLLGLPADGIGVLLATLLLGTPVLSLIGAIGVALTLGLRRGGVTLSLLVLPLYVPVLIFASMAVEGAVTGVPVAAQLYLLAALLAGALALAPLATAAALRVSLE